VDAAPVRPSPFARRTPTEAHMASLKIGIGRSIALNGSRGGFRAGMAAVMDDGRASIDG
jgi:hypothetical protein